MMVNHAEKVDWIDRAVATHNFHVNQKREHKGQWTIGHTAKALRRSTGSISEDLQIASYMKTHERKLRDCQRRKDALAFIKDKNYDVNDYLFE